MESLQNKKVLLIGASGGIGSALLPMLLKSKAQTFVTSRNKKKLQQLAEEHGLPIEHTASLDISKPKSVLELAQQVDQTIGTPDILINAAGIGIIKSLEDLEYEDFDRVIDTNLKGSFYLLKAFLPAMKKRKSGLIINLPGVLGKVPMAGAGAYAASKYGLNGLLKSVREELRRTDIRITNLYLGGTDTPFWDEIDLRVQRDKFVLAEEAAKAIWFLCQQPDSGVVSEMVLQPFNHQAI